MERRSHGTAHGPSHGPAHVPAHRAAHGQVLGLYAPTFGGQDLHRKHNHLKSDELISRAKFRGDAIRDDGRSPNPLFRVETASFRADFFCNFLVEFVALKNSCFFKCRKATYENTCRESCEFADHRIVRRILLRTTTLFGIPAMAGHGRPWPALAGRGQPPWHH